MRVYAFVHVCLCQPVSMFACPQCPPIHIMSVCLFLSISPSVCKPTIIFVCQPIDLLVCQFVCLTVCLYLSECLSISVYVIYVCLSFLVYISHFLPVSLSVTVYISLAEYQSYTRVMLGQDASTVTTNQLKLLQNNYIVIPLFSDKG